MSITSVVTSKGQMTLPAPIRKAFKIGVRSRRVRFEMCKDGSARIYPVLDALSLQGALADRSRPYDAKERQKTLALISRRVAKEGRK
jgi:bifunctional DNA-binding transcriptional regulator/antitoxin component of YhaV-PrlF toxin-antitoxin module